MSTADPATGETVPVDDEPIYWRRYGSTHAVSNLHRRTPGAARTRCGLKIPRVEPEVAKSEGLVYAGADVQLDIWEDMRCERCYPVTNAPARASRARWEQVDRERSLRLGDPHKPDFEAGASEIWRDGRGSVLVRQSGQWQLRRHRPGSSPRVDTWEIQDSRRPRLRPPTAWANRVLSGEAT